MAGTWPVHTLNLSFCLGKMGIITVSCCMGLGEEAAKLQMLGPVVGFAWVQDLLRLKSQTEIPNGQLPVPVTQRPRLLPAAPNWPQEPRQTGLTRHTLCQT